METQVQFNKTIRIIDVFTETERCVNKTCTFVNLAVQMVAYKMFYFSLIVNQKKYFREILLFLRLRSFFIGVK